MGMDEFTDAQLSSMSFNDIRKLRELFPDKASQNRLAPFDRSSYVMALMRDEGPMAGVLPALGSPIFEMLKFLPGGMGSRSDPLLANATAGLLGFGRGLNEWNQSKVVNRPRGLLE